MGFWGFGFEQYVTERKTMICWFPHQTTAPPVHVLHVLVADPREPDPGRAVGPCAARESRGEKGGGESSRMEQGSV